MKRLLFMHIHKTAGTSLNHYLNAQFEPAEICPFSFEFQVTAASADSLRQYRLFRGHISPWALAEKLDDEFDAITMLRNPRDRILSGYRLWHERGQLGRPGLPDSIRRIGNMSIGQFLRDPEYGPVVENVQARLLGGARFGPDNEHRIFVHGPLSPPRWARFRIVGLTERLDDMIRRLAATYGWPRAEAQRLNVSSENPPTLTDEDEALIEALTTEDRRVYAEAQRRIGTGPVLPNEAIPRG